ncbi:MAG: hypothetical protein ING90_15345 [Rhodocyclaceae bacterium]|nr:hypothetical protein [Rhodocyclaceae bacterium]
MTDTMAMPEIVGRSVAPRVISDAEYFVNDSAQPINRNLITDRLRVNLNRAARNPLVFVGRNHSQAVALERDLKRSGAVDVGTTGLTKAQAGADVRLGGRMDPRVSVRGWPARRRVLGLFLSRDVADAAGQAPSFRPSPSGFERIESAKGPESAGRSATATGHARLALTMPIHCPAGQGLRPSPRCVRCSGSQVQPQPPVRGP